MDRPNVLFFFPDQHRYDWVGFDGDVPVETPTLDGLAASGIGFRNAVCPSPVCGPSRACLASGYEYDRCGVRSHAADFPYAASTYFGRLRDEADYHVMGCGKFDLQKHSADWGLDGKNNLATNGFSDGVNNAGKWDCVNSLRGDKIDPDTSIDPADPYGAYLAKHDLARTHVDDFRRRSTETPAEWPDDVAATFPTELPEHAYCDNWIARRGIELLEDVPVDQPWHLVVNFAGPHNPWDVTEAMHDWYRDPAVEFPERVGEGGEMDRETAQAVRRNYAAMVTNIDRWLGRYLDLLERRGERENTIIVFASDHGEMLGDHGQWYKRSPYQPSTGVPLVVAGQGVNSRGIVDEPVSVLDLHATFLDYAGLDIGDVDSQSMRPYLAGETNTHRGVVHSGIGPWRLAFDGQYKLVLGYDPERGATDQVTAFDAWNEADVKYALRDRDPLLFDLDADPHETRNIASEQPQVVERLRGRIQKVRSSG